MRRRLYSIALILLALAVACSKPPAPIQVGDGTITINNTTSSEWKNVTVTVNDHFRGGAPALAAGGRLTAPLSQFQTAYGQKFQLNQVVFKVEVTATDADGKPVKLNYGQNVKR
jgi:hypothetical protein